MLNDHRKIPALGNSTWEPHWPFIEEIQINFILIKECCTFQSLLYRRKKQLVECSNGSFSYNIYKKKKQKKKTPTICTEINCFQNNNFAIWRVLCFINHEYNKQLQLRAFLHFYLIFLSHILFNFFLPIKR